MIRRCEFDRVLTAVRACGVAGELEQLINPRRVGRPRTLTVEVYLTAAILAATTYQSTTQTAIHRILTCDLARSLRIHHHLLVDGLPVTIDQVRYLLNAITRALTGDEPDGGGQDDVGAAARILDQIVDRIVTATVPDRFAAPRTVALDSTAVKSYARGKRRAAAKPDPGPDTPRPDTGMDAAPDIEVVEVGAAADPDASWGYCTRTQDNGSNRVFGYAAFTFVGIPAEGQAPDAAPKLTVGLRLRPANADVVEPGLSLLRAAADAADTAGTPPIRGRGRLTVMSDMAWSFKKAHRWAVPARELGADLVFDLHPDDRGSRDHNGLLMVDGYPHCPAMPEHLHRVERPQRLKVTALPARPSLRQQLDHARTTADLERFTAEIDERTRYAFRKVAGPDASGKERYECPAQAGYVICENCPVSQRLGPGHPTIDDPPQGADRPQCCTQRTVTLAGTADAKRRQRLRWGTPEWIDAYNRRTYVEGTYGSMKSSAGGNVRRGWCHARRQTKIAILLACAIAASNLALLRTWAARNGQHDLPLCDPDPPDHGFEELDADGNIDPAGQPPPANTG